MKLTPTQREAILGLFCKVSAMHYHKETATDRAYMSFIQPGALGIGEAELLDFLSRALEILEVVPKSDFDEYVEDRDLQDAADKSYREYLRDK